MNTKPQIESFPPGLAGLLLDWLDEGTDAAIYALIDGRFVYRNQAFRTLIGRNDFLLAEMAGRPRRIPDFTASASRRLSVRKAVPLALPSQLLSVRKDDVLSQRIIAREWLIRTQQGPLIVGCIEAPTGAADPEHALLRVALYDALTGLPNRSLLEDRLFQAIARARRSGKLSALLYVDLDDFKPVNDHHGHQAGDIVLQIISGRMLACVRETDTVARVGGDEFAIVLDEPEHARDVEAIARNLIARVSTPIALPNGTTVLVSASIGISLCPTNGTDLTSLINAADHAMYASKALGGGHFRVSAEPAVAAPIGEWMEEHEAEPVGVPEIDRQHEELISLANRLHCAVESAQPYPAQAALLDELIDYTRFHFSTEETLMDRYQDPDAEAHKRQHGQLVAQILFFRHALSTSDSQMILSALRPWLIRHIQSYDRALGNFLQAQQGR